MHLVGLKDVGGLVDHLLFINQINFQALIDLSSLELINRAWSSSRSSERTMSVCPSKLATKDPDFHSQILIVLSKEADAIKS